MASTRKEGRKEGRKYDKINLTWQKERKKKTQESEMRRDQERRRRGSLQIISHQNSQTFCQQTGLD